MRVTQFDFEPEILVRSTPAPEGRDVFTVETSVAFMRAVPYDVLSATIDAIKALVHAAVVMSRHYDATGDVQAWRERYEHAVEGRNRERSEHAERARLVESLGRQLEGAKAEVQRLRNLENVQAFEKLMTAASVEAADWRDRALAAEAKLREKEGDHAEETQG